MKRFFLFFCLLPSLFYAQTLHKKVSALFLGNSYTYVNNLPLLIYSIALANGDSLVYDSNCPGGYTFNNHFYDVTSISKINTFAWDNVVLQAQSQEPAFSVAQVNSQTLPYAIKLDSVIKQAHSCTNTIFYETWGRKNGDASNCANFPPVCTYLGMQNRLRQSYKQFADTTQGVLCPVGEAFRRSISSNPNLELYQADESHPSLEGSYLAAAVFYEVLFKKSVLSNTYNPGVGTNTLSFLQQTAHTVLNDSLTVWNIGKNLPWADYTFSLSGANSYQFQSKSVNLSNLWYFGDGSTLPFANPNHNYLSSGNYTVSHVVKENNCDRDSVSKVISVSVVSSLENQRTKIKALKLYPNPCSDFLNVEVGDVFDKSDSFIEISSIFGEVIYTSLLFDKIDISNFKSGVYFVKVYNKFATSNSHFVKNE